MLANQAEHDGPIGGTEFNSNQTSPYKGSPDKFGQLTKLDEEEENVDFLQMYNQF